MRKMRKHFERGRAGAGESGDGQGAEGEQRQVADELEEMTGKNVLIVKSDAALHPEQFDIQSPSPAAGQSYGFLRIPRQEL
jgi:hypothetical protein